MNNHTYRHHSMFSSSAALCSETLSTDSHAFGRHGGSRQDLEIAWGRSRHGCSSDHLSNSLVVPPDDTVDRKTQAAYADLFSQYTIELPKDVNPFTSSHNFPMSGTVQFLPGPGSPVVTERSITVAPGTHLFIPVVTNVVDELGFDPNWSVQDSRDAVRAVADTVTSQYFNLVTQDGREIPLVTDWADYRQSSASGGFGYTIGKDNIFDFPEGTATKAVQDGYWVMLNPLPVGEYKFHIGATVDYPKIEIDQNHNGIEGDTLGEQNLQDFRAAHDHSVTRDLRYTVKVDISALAS